MCKEAIKWAEDENRQFLRQTLQARLIRLCNELQSYKEGVRIGDFFFFIGLMLFLAVLLIAELKKIDDKDLIVEVQLEESKAYYHLSNLTKARSALTSARTTANSMYIPPKVQV